jgi:GntR family transcriptional repressor for pyruvate dehydrogenase complex
MAYDHMEDGALFEQVTREPRLSDKVADLILETILSRRLKVGDKLPSERELAEQFGVSRTVVREAVRGLAAKGVIEVRTGSGLRVAAVDASSVQESVSLFLRGAPIDLERVHEVRVVLEVHMAGLAAKRVTQADIVRLRGAHEHMNTDSGSAEERARDDLAFHRDIAVATHNELFVLLLDAIASSLVEIMRDNLGSGSTPMALDQHGRILEGIVARDADAAREAMAKHLEGVRSWAA